MCLHRDISAIAKNFSNPTGQPVASCSVLLSKATQRLRAIDLKKKRKKKEKPPKLKSNVNTLGIIWKAEMCTYTEGFSQHLPIPASNIWAVSYLGTRRELWSWFLSIFEIWCCQQQVSWCCLRAWEHSFSTDAKQCMPVRWISNRLPVAPCVLPGSLTQGLAMPAI